MRRFLPGFALPLLVPVLLTGCAAGTPFMEPGPPGAPDAYGHTEQAMPAALAQGWWKTWNDPVLDALVEEAVAANLDLKIAATRVLEAQAIAVQAGSERYPEVGLSARGGRTRSPATAFSDSQNNVVSGSVSASWELDLWGRIAYRTEAAERGAEAAREDQLRAYQSLVAQVVKAYVDARLYDEQARLTRETGATDGRRVEIVEARYDAGLVPSLDVYLIRQTRADTEARVHSFTLQAQTARHRLNVLLGRYPATPLDEAAEQPLDIPDPVPPGLPSELMLRRPDLRAAVDRFAAAHASADTARADLFPRISLTGAIGRESDDLEGIFVGDHTFWNLFGNLAYPLFNGGALRAEVDKQEAARLRAYLEYGNTVLAAFRQVEDALVTEREQRLRLVALEQSVAHAAQSLEASQSRYLRGLDDLIPSLNARRSLFLADLERIESRRRILANRADLHLALGGDWGHEDRMETLLDEVIAESAPVVPATETEK